MDRSASSIEDLELRRLLSATVGHGVLRVGGETDTANTISVALSSDATQYVVTVNGTATNVDATGVKKLSIVGGSAGDTISIDPNVKVKASIDGRAGDDTLTAGAKAVTINGGAGNDTITGSAKADVLVGGAGADSIVGGAGDDRIDAGAQADFINAGEGDNTVRGGAGDDTIIAGAGDDEIFGGAGTDSIDGGAGDNTIVQDPDTTSGGGGEDHPGGGCPSGAARQRGAGHAGNNTGASSISRVRGFSGYFLG